MTEPNVSPASGDCGATGPAPYEDRWCVRRRGHDGDHASVNPRLQPDVRWPHVSPEQVLRESLESVDDGDDRIAALYDGIVALDTLIAERERLAATADFYMNWYREHFEAEHPERLVTFTNAEDLRRALAAPDGSDE